jgi:Peptidase A4 family
MVIMTLITSAIIITVTLVPPKHQIDSCATKISGYALIDCSYHRLSHPPTNRSHKSSLAAIHSMEKSVHGKVKVIRSHNVAGYTIKTRRPIVKNSVKLISGGWIIPRVGNDGDEYEHLSVCVSMDSKTINGLVRVGTESDYDAKHGLQLNYAWFQIGNESPIMIVNFPAFVGDKISTAIQVMDKRIGQTRITIRNHTKGAAVVVPANFSIAPHADFSSASFLVETPTENCAKVAPMVDFGAVTFHDCLLMIDNVLGPINYSGREISPIHMIIEQNGLPKILARTSTLSPDAKSFTVSFEK